MIPPKLAEKFPPKPKPMTVAERRAYLTKERRRERAEMRKNGIKKCFVAWQQIG